MRIIDNSVDRMKSAISTGGGLLRSNRFRITLQRDGKGSDIEVLCDSVNLPGRQVATTEHFVGMKAYKKPYGYINDDITMTFVLTNDYSVWQYFNDWTNLVVTPDHEVNWKGSYTRDVKITTLDVNGNDTKTIQLLHAFPVTMNSVELSSANENDITQLTVMLAYDDWQNINTSY